MKNGRVVQKLTTMIKSQPREKRNIGKNVATLNFFLFNVEHCFSRLEILINNLQQSTTSVEILQHVN
jgi:hypothetical protein